MERTRIDLDASPYFASTVPIESATPTVMLLPPGVDPDTARAIIAATTPPAAPGAAELTAVAEAECDCADAIEYVVITGRATRCQLCGAPLEPTGGPRPVRFVPAADELVRRATLPGPAPDARVSVVRDPRPSSAPPTARSTRIEDDELVKVRGFLCYLRPERDGPLGWAPDGAPPGAIGSNWTPALRVQTSVEVPAILPGAFASAAAPVAAPSPAPGSTAFWLQRHGTLKRGLRALYEACGLAMATPEIHAKWDKLPPLAVIPAQQLHGRKLVLREVRAWLNEPEEVERPSEVALGTDVMRVVARQTERAAAETEAAIGRVLDSRGLRGSNSETETPLPAVDVRPHDAETVAPDPSA